MSLGVICLCIFPVIGLLGVGSNSVAESETKLEAANLATAILQKRLLAPATSQTGWSPLPPVDAASVSQSTFPATPPTAPGPGMATGILVDDGGNDVTGTPERARFGLAYRVWLDTSVVTSARLVRFDLVLSWPPHAAAIHARDQYELVTSALVSP